MEGLVKGRIVYLVLSALMVAEIMRRRTDGLSIKNRLNEGTWPIGAQAHLGNTVVEGDIVPAMVVGLPDNGSHVNVRAMLDGSDEYWAQSVPYDSDRAPGSWHRMFDGQQKRYNPSTT